MKMKKIKMQLKKDTQVGFGDVSISIITQFVPLPKVFMQCQCYLFRSLI